MPRIDEYLEDMMLDEYYEVPTSIIEAYDDYNSSREY